jgi:hypothetical protein
VRWQDVSTKPLEYARPGPIRSVSEALRQCSCSLFIRLYTVGNLAGLVNNRQEFLKGGVAREKRRPF